MSLSVCLCALSAPWYLPGKEGGQLSAVPQGAKPWCTCLGTKPGTTVPVLQQPRVVKFHPGAAPAVSSMPARVTSHPS